MNLLDLLNRDIPPSALGKRVRNIDNGISGAIGSGYLCLPILKAHP